MPKESHSTAAHAKPHLKKYFEGVGRRKTSIARVRIMEGAGKVIINGKETEAYFSLPRLRSKVSAPFTALSIGDKLDASVKVVGGGIASQAEAIRHGIARALVVFDPSFKKRLRAEGFLTRDSRMVERKKYGLKKARRAPQWQKR